MLLAFGLRLVNISAEPYWADEILSLDIVMHSHGVGEMLRYLGAVEFHPPLYYLTMLGWTSVFGVSELATRMLSVIFSLGTVVLGFVAGWRIIGSRGAGLITAFLLAVLPMQIEFGQEARPYAMMCFFGAAAMILLWEYLHKRHLGYAIGYAVCSLIGIYLHYSFGFFAFALAVWWLAVVLFGKNGSKSRSRQFVDWLVVHFFMFLGFLPWLVPFLYKLSLSSHEIYGLVYRIKPERATFFVEGLISQMVWLNKEIVVTRIEGVTIVFFKVLLILFAIKSLVDFRAHYAKSDVAVAKYLSWIVICMAVLFMVAPQSVYYTRIFFRHVILLTIPLILLLVMFAARIGKERSALLVTLFAVSLVPSMVRVLSNDIHTDHDFRIKEAAEIINANYREGDVFITYVAPYRTNMAHYLNSDIPIKSLLPTNYYGHDILADRHRLGISENELQVRIVVEPDQNIKEKLATLIEQEDAKRVWLYPLLRQDQPVKDWFRDNSWRVIYPNSTDLFPLEMYSKK